MTLQKKTLVSKKAQPSTKAANTRIETGNVVTARRVVSRKVTLAKRFVD